jgi:hypothetical protein
VVDGLVDVEEEDLRLLLLDDPVVGEVDDAAAVDEEEELDAVVGARLLDAGGQLTVGSHWVDLVLDLLALEEFLSGRSSTVKILSVQRESVSTAVKITMET